MVTKNLLRQIRFLIRETNGSSKKTHPEYFRISNEKDLKRLSAIIRRNDIRVYDIEQSGSTRSVSGSEYMHKGNANTDVWVYYPWLKELVRFSVPEQHLKSKEGNICFWGINPIIVEVAKMMALSEVKTFYIYDKPFSTTQDLLLSYENTGLSAPAALTRELYEINPFLEIIHDELNEHTVDQFFITNSFSPTLILSGSNNPTVNEFLKTKSRESSAPFITLLKSSEKDKISFRGFFPKKLQKLQLGETSLAFFDLDNLTSGYTITVPSLSAAVILTELCKSILKSVK